MTMGLPECHDAAIEKAARSMFVLEYEREYSSSELAVAWKEMIPERKTLWLAKTRAAITAYLSALKDQGLMREAHQYPYARGEFWEATTLLEDHNALIIRTESEQ